MIKALVYWTKFFIAKRSKNLVRYNIIKVIGNKFILNGHYDLQCAYCLYMQDAQRYTENSLIDPAGALYGFYLKEERHEVGCKQGGTK